MPFLNWIQVNRNSNCRHFLIFFPFERRLLVGMTFISNYYYHNSKSSFRYIARRMMKSGLYMQGARSGWLEANPSKPLWSHEAIISLGDLLTLARIFSIVPKVVCESELIDIAIVLIKEVNRKRRRKQNIDQDFSLNWNVFQELCVKLAERFVIQKSKWHVPY